MQEKKALLQCLSLHLPADTSKVNVEVQEHRVNVTYVLYIFKQQYHAASLWLALSVICQQDLMLRLATAAAASLEEQSLWNLSQHMLQDGKHKWQSSDCQLKPWSFSSICCCAICSMHLSVATFGRTLKLIQVTRDTSSGVTILP